MRRSPLKRHIDDQDSADGRGPGGTTGGKPRRRETTPAQRALGFLVRREHSRLELTRKLLARGVHEEEAIAAVDRMSDAGWQDDGRFACSLARTRAAAGYGPLWIRSELASHRLSSAAVEQAFAALAEFGEDNWAARARDLVHRRHGSPERLSLAVQRKAADFLLRRGYGSDSIQAAIRSLPED